MADLTITVGNIRLESSCTVELVTYGAASITPMMPLYRDTSDNKYKICDASASATGDVDGLALVPGDADGIGVVLKLAAGTVNIGATLTQGVTYYVSNTAGKICLYSDLITGDIVTPIGVASSTSLLEIKAHNSGATVP